MTSTELETQSHVSTSIVAGQKNSAVLYPVMKQRTAVNIVALSPPSFLPSDAFDTHVHIFDPSLGPYCADRAYTPADATLGELFAFSSELSSERRPANIVLVQPSPYGTDNRVLVSILKQLRAEGTFVRAIAVVDVDKVKDEELEHLHRLGVRGLRLNMQASGRAFDIQELKNLIQRAAARIEELPNWKLQLFIPAHVWADLHSTIVNLPVVFIADHTGGLLGSSKIHEGVDADPTSQVGFKCLVDLAKKTRVLIKVSALYRSSCETFSNHADMAPVIRELARQVPDSLIWGSDWPHTGEGSNRLKVDHLAIVEPFRHVDNAGILSNLRDWIDDDEIWQKMMVDNPRRAFA